MNWRESSAIVRSGTNARGFEFYHKLFVGEDDGRWYIDFDFTYANSEREKYDPICSRLARSFTLLPGEHDHLANYCAPPQNILVRLTGASAARN